MSSLYASSTIKMDQKPYTTESDLGSQSTDQITNTSKPSGSGSPHFNAMPVMIRGVLYPSHVEASKAMGVTPSAISQRLRVKGSAETVGLGLAGSVPGNTNAAKETTIFGETFASRVEAAKALGISRKQITRWISPQATPLMRDMLMAAMMQYKMKRGKH